MDNNTKVDTETVAPAKEAADVSQPPKKKKMATWKKVLIGVAAFIVVIIIIAFTATSGAGTASDEFVNDVLANKGAAAYVMLSPEAKKTVSESDFSSVVSRMSAILDDKATQTSREVNTETGSDPKATVLYKVNGSDGTYTLTVNMVQVDGKWQVNSFDSKMNK